MTDFVLFLGHLTTRLLGFFLMSFAVIVTFVIASNVQAPSVWSLFSNPDWHAVENVYASALALENSEWVYASFLGLWYVSVFAFTLMLWFGAVRKRRARVERRVLKRALRRAGIKERDLIRGVPQSKAVLEGHVPYRTSFFLSVLSVLGLGLVFLGHQISNLWQRSHGVRQQAREATSRLASDGAERLSARFKKDGS